MCNQVQSVTLQTAVLLTVKEFAQKNQPFSVHDVTRQVRAKTASGELEIPEVEVSGASFRFDIPHVKVRELFLELWRTGIFDPDFTLSRSTTQDPTGSYSYYLYTPSSLSSVQSSTTTTVTTPAPVNVFAGASPTVTPTVTPTKVTRSEVTTRIDLYLVNCAKRNFQPTLKQVQSAIKRGDASTGWSCEDIREIIERDLTYPVVDDPDYISAAQVVVK